MAACADLPCTTASSCRQPLCEITMPYEKPAQMAKSGLVMPLASSQAGPTSPPTSSS
jgi:hypothetical protein